MRKILAVPALAGVALFAVPAHAGMEITLGGYNDFRAGFFDNDLTTSPRRNNDFQDEFQLEIEAKAKAQNGMEYGVVASLWNGWDYAQAPDTANRSGGINNTSSANNDIRIHQAYGYVNGAWGQIRMGDEHGASDFGVEAPQTYDWGGQVDGYYYQFLTPASVFAITPSFLDQTEDNTKVSYFTPKFGINGHKFQLGTSYTPNWYDAGTGVIVNDPTTRTQGNPMNTANYKNLFEIGGGYEGVWMNNITTKLGFVVTTGDAIDNRTYGGMAANRLVQDFTSWDVGGQVGYAGFTLGANYTDAGRFNSTAAQTKHQHVWDAGLSYKFDRASIAGSYLHGEGYNNMAAGNASTPSGAQSNFVKNYNAWGIGAGYSLFYGMVTSVDAVFFHQEGSGTVANDHNTDGHVVILSNRISF